MYMAQALTLKLLNVKLIGNTSWSTGGGLYLSNQSNVIFRNVLIAKNHSVNGAGGISLGLSTEDIYFINGTITGNTSTNSYPAFSFGTYDQYAFYIINSIIWEGI